MKEEIFTYLETHITGGTSLVSITRSQIIRYMKGKQIDGTDQDLVDNFVAINWCRKKK